MSAYSPSLAQALRIAVRPSGIDGEDELDGEDRGEGRRQHPGRDRVIAPGPGALLRLPPRAGRQELPGVDEDPLRPLVETHPAQRVVELVAQEHAAHPEGMQLVEAGVDVGPVALGHTENLLAAERFRGLHAEDDGELALLDHAARLGRRGDDTEPALPRPAREAVDMVLQAVCRARLPPDVDHVVARGLPRREQLAERGIGDQVGHEHPLPAAPGPLDPLVVHLLVGQRVVCRPVPEGRIPHRIVLRVERGALGRVLQQGGRAVGIVARAIPQRVRDPGLAVGRPADDAPAEAVVGEQVAVRVDQAAQLPGGGGPGERGAGDADLGVAAGGARDVAGSGIRRAGGERNGGEQGGGENGGGAGQPRGDGHGDLHHTGLRRRHPTRR